jgi:hypothetical protein
MNILLATDAQEEESAKLCKIDECFRWALVEIEEGRISHVSFAQNRESFDEIPETVVVIDDNEYVWPFIEEQMQVLVAPTQRYIDDIVEAYLFKELHELAY